MPHRNRNTLFALAAALALSSAAFAQTQPAHNLTRLMYSFGPTAPQGFTKVAPDDAYTKDKGYGIDLWSKVSAGPAFITGTDNQPFFFSAKIAPGAYRVTVTLGDPKAETIATVKSETRRLMLESVRVPAGQSQSFSFLVHIRVPVIPGAAGAAATVALKPRERDPILFIWDEAHHQAFTELDWDEKLTLEFAGAHPALQSVEITDAPPHTTVYLIGDSTMTDQMMEPWAAWGQMFPRFFKEPLLIANYAECGETTASFISERRWAKIMSEIHEGDFVFMQFGINDQRMQLDAFKNCFVTFIDDTRAKTASPVLVTSQNLKRLGPDGKGVQTLGLFPDAMKQVAKDKSVPLIDLNEMSQRLYAAIGPGPDKLDKAFSDGTHHSDYGAYELAKCVVQGVIDQKLPLARYVADDWKTFDPAQPDPIAAFKLPLDPQWDPAFDSPTKTSPSGNGPMAGAAPAGARGTAPARGRDPATTTPANP